MSANDAIPHEIFELGDLPLQGGGALREARLAYATYGRLNTERTNVVVLPTAYGGTHVDNEWMIGAESTFDPERWFVVSPNLFGAGLSTSPSRAHASQTGAAFPQVSLYDNVTAQHRLVVDHLGARKIALVAGFSMGAQQTYHWAAFAPHLVERIAPICGSARTAEHNRVYLEGIEVILQSAGRRAVGSAWAAWGMSQTFYREERWRELGFSSRAAFVTESYLESFEKADAGDLLAMLRSWYAADIGAHERYEGDTKAALRAIEARAIVMPSRTDTYFPPEDSLLEVAAMPHAELAVIESVFGHAAGAGIEPAASAFMTEQIHRLLKMQ